MNGFKLRVALLAGILGILLFVIFDYRIFIPSGVFTGAFLAARKVAAYKKLLGGINRQENEKSGQMLLLGGLYSALPFLILLVAIIVDKWFFMGIAVGLLSTPAIIIINIITEQIGLTHNQWAEWF